MGKNEPVCIADEVPFEIPESWEWVRLGTILHKLSDGTHSRPHYVASGIPFISVKDVSGGKLDFSDCKYITEEEHRELYSRCKPEYGDILLTKVGTTGIPVIVDTTNEFSLFVSVALLKFNQEMLSNEYLVCLINSPLVQKQAEKNTRGVGNKNWVMRDIANTLIVIPPLLEQKRIVSKLQKILPFVDNYAHAYSKVEELNNGFPDLFKKSILQEAVRGKLVPQDPSDESASVLLERIRAEKKRLIQEGKIKRDKHESVIFRRDNSYYEKHGSEEVCIDDEIPFEIPENWIWTRLQNICSLIGDIDHNMPKSVSADVGVLFLSAKDLLDDGTINYTQNVKYISRADFERLSRKALPQKHDIIYSRIGAALGKARLVEIDREFLVSYSCCVVRPLLVYAPYIRYYLESPQILLHSIKARQSIGVPDLGMGEIKKYLVALPPYNEQMRIVEQLEILLDKCDFKM